MSGIDLNHRYFSRAATWQHLDGRLLIHDSFSPKAPRMVTMEPWHEVVFMRADGEHTIAEFVAHMGSQYESGTPAGLEAQIHGIINELVNEGLLRLHDERKALPPYFADEYTKIPAEMRKAQMEADGLLPRK